MEITESFLAELLSMARKRKPDKTRCKNCTQKRLDGRRGLCAECWKLFDSSRRKARREIAKRITKLTAKQARQGLTLDEVREQALEEWDKLQVTLGLIETSHKGPRSKKVSPFTRTA